MNDKNPKWEPVINIDFARRKAEDWAVIYGVELISQPPDDRLWSEYEWSYFFVNADYRPKNTDFDKLAEMEMRALEIRRDIFWGATLVEKDMLKEKYVETDWVRRRLNVL